jgi:hypothetical protein
VHLHFIDFRFFPYGANGMLAGSATVFFAYIGFDSVASTAEEVRKTSCFPNWFSPSYFLDRWQNLIPSSKEMDV